MYKRQDRQGDVDVFKQKYPKHFYMDSIEDKFSVLGNFGLSSKIFNLDFIKSNNISFPEYIHMCIRDSNDCYK